MRYDINEFTVESDFALPYDATGCSPRDISEADKANAQRGVVEALLG